MCAYICLDSVIALLIWSVQAGVVKASLWVHASPRAAADPFFPNHLPVCLECPAASSPLHQQREEWWCTWPQDVARLPASEKLHKLSHAPIAWLISKAGATPLLSCVCGWGRGGGGNL